MYEPQFSMSPALESAVALHEFCLVLGAMLATGHDGQADD